MPRGIPITTLTAVEMIPTKRETRPPYRSRLSTSRPTSSPPRICFPPGGALNASASISASENGRNGGTNITISAIVSSTKNPATASLLLQYRLIKLPAADSFLSLLPFIQPPPSRTGFSDPELRISNRSVC